ncbi:MAG: hypothetical protein M5U12_26600 [Verrucomicrobia bacterium]|nr:hypothetical protein [Verrucomicrobiota bacterium]
MNDRPEHPERRSSTTALVEVAQLDLRYEGCRLDAGSGGLAFVGDRRGSIQELLQGVDVAGVRILLNGFKRLRCAQSCIWPRCRFVALAADETAGIVWLLRASNDRVVVARTGPVPG